MRAGIPTLYSGVRFRSRLEAKWAAFFDGCGWGWEYEPLDLAGWIPDFLLIGAREQVLVEVKPATSVTELRQNVSKIVAAKPDRDVLLVGAWLPEECTNLSGPSLGLLWENSVHGFGCTGQSPDPFESAYFFVCTECGKPTFCSDLMSYHSRMCGHYEGDHFLGDPSSAAVRLRRLWVTSGNVVQWHPWRNYPPKFGARLEKGKGGS